MIHTIVEAILKQLSSPFISGGLVLMFTGAIVAFARNLPMRLWHKLLDQFMVEVSVTNNDPLFDWITLWLNEQPYSTKTRRLIGTTIANYGGDSGAGVQCVPACVDGHSDEVKRPRLILSPAKGQHFFLYQGKLLWLSRGSGDTAPSGAGGEKGGMGFHSRFTPETYSLRVLGRSQSLLRSLLNDVIDQAMSYQEKKISAFVGMYSNWRRLRTFSPRKMESVILPDGIAETILQKLKDFIAARDWYQQMGIPYHFGMLFHGSPGSGKTSMIAALAGELKMNLYILSLASEDMNDERFACLLSEIPPSSFMVLEDVDSAFATRSRKSDDGQPAHQGLTLTGILNALDGFMATEGSIVLMTTNHKERLDPALIRPGRVDFEVQFGAATRSQLRRLYQRFFPNSNGDAEVWALASEGKTMAEAQQDLLELKKRPAEQHELTTA